MHITKVSGGTLLMFDSGFLHTHKTHEELYFILKGEGRYQVDGEIFPVSEGTIIRVAPEGKRALKNTGNENLTMLCIQYKANAFTEADSPMRLMVIFCRNHLNGE